MPRIDYKRIRATYGKTWAKTGEIEIDDALLHLIGDILVETVKIEAKNEFVKRGWSMNDPQGGPPIGSSFGYDILGDRTVVLKSSFYGLTQLTSREGIPERKMTWLTQQGQQRNVKSKEQREWESQIPGISKRPKSASSSNSPLVVPLTTDTGEVIFRMAPLKTADAWIHPGIARFNFFERALKKARMKVSVLMTEYCGNVISAGIAEAFNNG